MTVNQQLDAKAIEALLAAAEAGGEITLDHVPPVTSAEQKATYATLAEQLYGGLPGPPEERGRTPRGQLASALWQRIAEWDDAREDAGDAP